MRRIIQHLGLTLGRLTPSPRDVEQALEVTISPVVVQAVSGSRQEIKKTMAAEPMSDSRLSSYEGYERVLFESLKEQYQKKLQELEARLQASIALIDLSKRKSALEKLEADLQYELGQYQEHRQQRQELDQGKTRGEGYEQIPGTNLLKKYNGFQLLYSPEVVMAREQSFQSILEKVKQEFTNLETLIKLQEEERKKSSVPQQIERIKAEIGHLIDADPGEITTPIGVERTTEAIRGWVAKRLKSLYAELLKLEAELITEASPAA